MIVIAAVESWWLIGVRMDRANRTYSSILKDIERVTRPEDVIASSYPQMITCMTGRASVGGTWLTENIENIIKKCQPDIILVDNARDEPNNYGLFIREYGQTIPGYALLVHNPEERYLILRSIDHDNGGRAGLRSDAIRPGQTEATDEDSPAIAPL